MLKSLVGSVLLVSTMAGCYQKTQTCTIGNICWEENNSSYQPQTSEDNDHHEAIIAAAAVVTAIALVAVIAHRGGNDEKSRPAPSPARASAPPVTYIVPPASATSGDDIRLQRMYVQGHLSARAGRCDAVTAIGRRLAVVSPSYHERYVADPTIAVCLRARG